MDCSKITGDSPTHSNQWQEISADRITDAQSSNGPDQFDIHQISFEVIAHIFEFYAHDHRNHKGPLSLGAVCHRWRQIAWNTPRLWTTLTFKVKGNATESKVQLSIDWLNRSGSLPLTVDLGVDVDEPWLEAHMIPLVEIVNQSLTRCLDLTLSNLTHLTLPRLLPIQGPSILNRLRFDAMDSSSLNLGLEAKPKKLIIDEVRLSALFISWSNITDLQTNRLRTEEVLRILILAPQITTCYHSNVQHPPLQHMLPGEPDILLHSQLKSLEFTTTMRNSWSFESFMQRTSLPNLTYCAVYLAETEFPTDDFLDFVARSFCALQELHINNAHITSDELIQIAKALPSITSLTLFHDLSEDLDESLAFDNFYSALCLDPRYRTVPSSIDNVVLLPSLQSLSIYTRYSVPWHWLPGFYRHFRRDGLVSRMPLGRSNLKSISICRYDSESSQDHNSYFEDAQVEDKKDMDVEDALRYPRKLIQTWEAYFKLKTLKHSVALNLEILDSYCARYELFEVSYRYLNDTIGPPLDMIDGATVL